jgi:HlyD family secretion protein
VAEIPDLATLEIEGKIEEVERGRVTEGADTRIRIDSLPELRISARLRSVSALTQMSFDWPPTATFRGFAPIENPDPRLRPGMSGTMDVVVRRFPGARIVPSKALFTRDGEPVVFVQQDAVQRAVRVEVVARNQDEVAVNGVEPGMMVTLVEPSEIRGAS